MRARPATTQSYRDTVAAYFRARPCVWVTHRVLMRIGGECAWRTRVSECRTQLGMTIETSTVFLRRRPSPGAAPVIVTKIVFRKFVPRVEPQTTVAANGQVTFVLEAAQ